MNATVLDTLRCAQTLKDAGFTPKQADATAQVLGDALADVATKEDLDRHTVLQKADLERHAASQKADLERHAASQKADLERHAASQKADLDNAVASLNAKIDAMDQKFETKFDAMNQRFDSMDQRFDSMETSTQNQLVGLREEIKVLADVFKHHIRTTYIVLASFGTLATLATIAAVALGTLAYLPPRDETPAVPAAAESPGAAPEIHSAPGQTRIEAEPPHSTS